jgi:hypothetical protein
MSGSLTQTPAKSLLPCSHIHRFQPLGHGYLGGRWLSSLDGQHRDSCRLKLFGVLTKVLDK